MVALSTTSGKPAKSEMVYWMHMVLSVLLCSFEVEMKEEEKKEKPCHAEGEIGTRMALCVFDCALAPLNTNPQLGEQLVIIMSSYDCMDDGRVKSHRRKCST